MTIKILIFVFIDRKRVLLLDSERINTIFKIFICVLTSESDVNKQRFLSNDSHVDLIYARRRKLGQRTWLSEPEQNTADPWRVVKLPRRFELNSWATNNRERVFSLSMS